MLHRLAQVNQHIAADDQVELGKRRVAGQILAGKHADVADWLIDAVLPVQPGEKLLTSYQVLQMATWSGAVAAGLGSKVGRLVPGLEADVIVLNARSLNTWPLNNAPGAIVTAMDDKRRI